MPTLNVRVSRFQGTYTGLNGQQNLQVSKLRCLKAAKNVGVPLLRSAAPNARHAMTMAAYKAFAVKAAIDFSGADLNRPKQYVKLDPSEKGNISFWTGMTFATIVANDLLGVPQLLHAAALTKKCLAKTNPNGRRLADLVGLDTNQQWHVIEAKARQAEPSNKTLDDWRVQATTVATIDNTAPATRSYCLTKVRGVYSVSLVDPPQRPNAVNLSLTHSARINSILEGYYGPWRDFLSTAAASTVIRNAVNLRVRMVAFDGLDSEYVFVGILEDVLKELLIGVIPPATAAAEGADYYIGSDGLAVLTSPTSVLV